MRNVHFNFLTHQVRSSKLAFQGKVSKEKRLDNSNDNFKPENLEGTKKQAYEILKNVPATRSFVSLRKNDRVKMLENAYYSDSETSKQSVGDYLGSLTQAQAEKVLDKTVKMAGKKAVLESPDSIKAKITGKTESYETIPFTERIAKRFIYDEDKIKSEVIRKDRIEDFENSLDIISNGIALYGEGSTTTLVNGTYRAFNEIAADEDGEKYLKSLLPELNKELYLEKIKASAWEAIAENEKAPKTSIEDVKAGLSNVTPYAFTKYAIEKGINAEVDSDFEDNSNYDKDADFKPELLPYKSQKELYNRIKNVKISEENSLLDENIPLVVGTDAKKVKTATISDYMKNLSMQDSQKLLEAIGKEYSKAKKFELPFNLSVVLNKLEDELYPGSDKTVADKMGETLFTLGESKDPVKRAYMIESMITNSREDFLTSVGACNIAIYSEFINRGLEEYLKNK